MKSERPFPSAGLVRLKEIIAPHGPLPICRSTFLAGVRTGRFPQPVKIGPRISAWHAEDISDLIASFKQGPSKSGP